MHSARVHGHRQSSSRDLVKRREVRGGWLKYSPASGMLRKLAFKTGCGTVLLRCAAPQLSEGTRTHAASISIGLLSFPIVMTARLSALYAACIGAIVVGQSIPQGNVTLLTRACRPGFDSYPFCNTTLSIDERVADLINRLELSDIPPLLTARHGWVTRLLLSSLAFG